MHPLDPAITILVKPLKQFRINRLLGLADGPGHLPALLDHDPNGVAINLQAAFLSPPVAMSAFYLKGVSPPHVQLRQIFAGMMPYMLIVLLCLVFMYVWPGMSLWLPEFLYGP